MLPSSLDTNLIITVASVFLATLSVAAFAISFLDRMDRRERFKDVVHKRRKDLFEQQKEKNAAGESTSAKDSLAGFYKAQKMAGRMGERVRERLLQAGIRDPGAPIKFMIAQAVFPVLLVIWVIFMINTSWTDLSPGLRLLAILGVAVAGYKLPDLLVKNQSMKRQEAINLSFPDALDMMLICVQGGISLEQTIDRVAHEISEHSPVLAEELGILSAEMAMLNDRKAALRAFSKRVGSGAGRSFSTALIQAEQYGTSLSQAMRVLADELRDIRMSKAEEKAASLPPKLTVPMIVFFLPALFIVILGPAGISASGM